jgi:hypothetical protein
MPLYVADYLADTAHLNAAQSGAYLHLIMHYWQAGGLPQNDDALARIARMTPAEWKNSKEIILGLFEPNGWGIIPAQSATGGSDEARRPNIPTDIRNAVFERDGNVCSYCGSSDGPFQIDHMIPWVVCREHAIENLVVACCWCNWSKGALTPSEWKHG